MGIAVSLIGKSGSGKSTSFRNFLKEDGSLKDEVFIIRMGRKPLPFKNKMKPWDKVSSTGDYIFQNDGDIICQILEKFTKEFNKKVIIIDDSTFAMTDYFMKTAYEKGLARAS